MIKRILPYGWPILILLPLLLVAKWSDSWGTLIIVGAAITAAGEFVLPLEKDSARHVWSRRIVLSGVVLTIVAGFLDNSAKKREQLELAAKVEEDLGLARENTEQARVQTDTQRELAGKVEENLLVAKHSAEEARELNQQASALGYKLEKALDILTGGDSVFQLYFRGGFRPGDAPIILTYTVHGENSVPLASYAVYLRRAVKDGKDIELSGLRHQWQKTVGPILATHMGKYSVEANQQDTLEQLPEADGYMFVVEYWQGTRHFQQLVVGTTDSEGEYNFNSRTFEISPIGRYSLRKDLSEGYLKSQLKDDLDAFASSLDGKEQGHRELSIYTFNPFAARGTSVE